MNSSIQIELSQLQRKKGPVPGELSLQHFEYSKFISLVTDIVTTYYLQVPQIFLK